ncbi:PstS family phosphate ABC transporter substrate-binding protein [Desertibacillus haloalkaliphilus]|uniref:PstS family phosphate ABC transporter substrate-binding protein n=1 Tax=Desertibacillus haloalkaliphilus TaxID=1328930 RepID=UPI001C275B8B|nr:substrate-binding domain-containing protein [Desertibacillus haloalkaliphilus]MBU8906821.1 substrate-binding domain-containing protein [Desertibacillus haloalkaliphilus]
MKLLFAFLVVIVLGFVGYIAAIIASIMLRPSFYVPFVTVVTIGLIAIVILTIYGQMKRRDSRMGVFSFIILAIVSVITYESYQSYLESLEIVSTQDVDLLEYRPFAEQTKAVSLDEESMYRIEENLPLLDGATALYPVYAGFVQAVYPEKEYPLHTSEVVSSQTANAFERLLYSDVDIIFIAEPSATQFEQAERLGVELTLTPIGREAFVFFVHHKNPVDELTIDQLQGIYSGEITNWQDVGGKNERIRAFQRPEGSGSQSALQSMMNSKPLMDPPSEDIVSAMGGIITETTNYRNRSSAIGFSFRYFSGEMVGSGEIKHIAVEGVRPTVDTIQTETYPIVDQFYAITRTDHNHPHIDKFIEWMRSEQGQQIVEQTGYVPLQ